jgi:hypothetical protein
MRIARCPTCAADLDGKVMCPRCGSLPGIEAYFQQTKGNIDRFVSSKKAAILPSRFEAQHFLWACAIIPLFVLPPLVSLTYAVVAMRKPANQSVQANFEWIAIISAINIVVSILLLYKLHFLAGDLLEHLPFQIRTFLRNWFYFQPPEKPPIKVMPV